jgi:hypothetical protein
MLNDEFESQMQDVDQDGFLLVNIEPTPCPTYNLDYIDDQVFEEILCESFFSPLFYSKLDKTGRFLTTFKHSDI